jgi:hypothetical protein
MDFFVTRIFLTRRINLDKFRAFGYKHKKRAGIAQVVEYELPKLGVAGSKPAARSKSENLGCAALFPQWLTAAAQKPHSFGRRIGFFFRWIWRRVS